MTHENYNERVFKVDDPGYTKFIERLHRVPAVVKESIELFRTAEYTRVSWRTRTAGLSKAPQPQYCQCGTELNVRALDTGRTQIRCPSCNWEFVAPVNIANAMLESLMARPEACEQERIARYIEYLHHDVDRSLEVAARYAGLRGEFGKW